MEESRNEVVREQKPQYLTRENPECWDRRSLTEGGDRRSLTEGGDRRSLTEGLHSSLDKQCEELLENIQRSLHECKDNRTTINIMGILDITQCSNVKTWHKNIKSSVPLKMDIRNTQFVDRYSIDYKVGERSLTIS